MPDTPFHVELVAVESRIYSGEATFVVAQTTEGAVGLLAKHEPMLGQLSPGGYVAIDEVDGKRRVAAVQGGFISVTGEAVTILAESAEWARDVDEAAERSVLSSAEKGSVEYLRAESRLRAVEVLQQVK